MQLADYSSLMLPEIENELHSVLDLFRHSTAASPVQDPSLPELADMLAYHLGWSSPSGAASARGKRIRPLLTLLSCAACGGTWQKALPAAAAVELVHNFSLIHDDIQDESPFRHGRPAVWKKWGAAQAINAGDLMFSLALVALLRPDRPIEPGLASRSGYTILQTCLHLTRGQSMDLAFEKCDALKESEYWVMVSGKTSSLLAASASLGGMFAGAPEPEVENLAEFGTLLGRAYQAQDDLLGIWGRAAQTGKPVDSDLGSRKMTLPVIFGLEKGGQFARLWSETPPGSESILRLADALEADGAREYTLRTCNHLTKEALQALSRLPGSDARDALEELAKLLLGRQS